MSEEKLHAADIEPMRPNYHVLIVNGKQVGRFDDLQKALAARQMFLQPKIEEGQER
jgi:hypothetical protein